MQLFTYMQGNSDKDGMCIVGAQVLDIESKVRETLKLSGFCLQSRHSAQLMNFKPYIMSMQSCPSIARAKQQHSIVSAANCSPQHQQVVSSMLRITAHRREARKQTLVTDHG